MIERYERWGSPETCSELRALCQPATTRYCDQVEPAQALARCVCPPGLRVETVVLEMRSAPHPGAACHADNVQLVNGVWVPNHTPNRKVSAILYLEACEGGELVFWQLGERVRPAEGLVVRFPSDGDHVHEVLPITGGVRRTLAMWFA